MKFVLAFLLMSSTCCALASPSPQKNQTQDILKRMHATEDQMAMMIANHAHVMARLKAIEDKLDSLRTSLHNLHEKLKK